LTSLKEKTVSSVKWTTLQTAIVGIIGPVTLIIKAKFLTPEEFAYLAIITIIIGLFHLLESFGISQAIIQRDAITNKESSSLFFFNIVFCFLLAVILYVLSPFIAVFFSMPGLELYLQFISLMVFISGPSLLLRAFLEKNLFFKHLSIIEILRNLLSLVSLTILFLLGLGILGVILAQIFSTLFATIAIVFITIHSKSFKLSFYFRLKQIIPFFSFGLFVTGKQLTSYIAHRMDELVIGYFLAPEILGIYHFGKNILEKIRTLITSSFGKVLFPVFSKLKNDREKLSFSYQRISRYIAMGAFPIFTGIAITAHLFVPVIFGEQWRDSVIVFQIFSMSMFFLILTANVSTSLLYAVNKPGLVFYIDMITNAIYFISLMLFASKGMIAVLILYSFYIIYKTLILQYFTNIQLVQNFATYLKALAFPFISAIAMGIIVILFQMMLSQSGEIMQLTISIMVGGLVSGLLNWWFNSDSLKELKGAFF
jgi:O-antigen/teichoic acid export membrane protein